MVGRSRPKGHASRARFRVCESTSSSRWGGHRPIAPPTTLRRRRSVVDAGPLQLVLPPELAPLDHGDGLDLVDAQIAALELEAVRAARDRDTDRRRLLSGIGAIDPEIRPWIRAH